jgi:hypothetical protein
MLLKLMHAAHLRCQMGGARGALSRQQWDLLEGLECSIRKGEQAFRFSEQPSIGSVSHAVVVKLAMVCRCTVICWCCGAYDRRLFASVYDWQTKLAAYDLASQQGKMGLCDRKY